MNIFRRLLEAFDRFQQRHGVLGFPIAVMKKFGDDRAVYLAALIAYYGFFSLFPLLLLFVSVLGLVLSGNPDLQRAIEDSAFAQFPVIGEQIRENVEAIKGSAFTLGVGIAGTLWAGLGVTLAAQHAMNRVWDIPRKDRPSGLKARLRGLVMLAVLGTITILSTVLTGFAASSGSGPLGVVLRVAGLTVSLLLNFALFTLVYRVLTVKRLRWGDVFPGAAVAAVVWTALQSVGGFFLTRQIENASEVYGTFALVIGLLVWIYLGAQLTMYCAEINVVRARRLWPRSLLQKPPFTEPDRDVMTAAAKQEEWHPAEAVEVEFRQD